MNARKLLTAGSVALISLATGAMAAPAGKTNPVWTGHDALQLVQIEGLDPRAPEELSNQELRIRIQLLRQFAEAGRAINGVPARILLRADRQELDRRQNSGERATEQVESESGDTGTAVPSEGEQGVPQAVEAERPRRKPLSELPTTVVPEQPVREAPAAEQAAPEEPQTNERRERRKAEPREPAQEQPVAEEPQTNERRERRKAEPREPAQEQPVAEEPRPRRDRKQPEAETQQAAPQQPQRAQEPRIDLSVLRDRRQAAELTDAELRDRIRALTELQMRAMLDNRQMRRLQATLEADKGELNRRITATTGVDVGGFDANREARRLLGDNRPARRLNDDQLRERIRLTRGVLSLGGLDPRFEDQLRRALRQDRQEIRSRVAEAEQPRIVIRDPQRVERRELRRQMIDAREQRRRRLDDPSYRIVIPDRRIERRPLATIPLAEAYDEELEYQLSAPPSRRIERRYTIDEYRANPSLRTLMPGIEVDTVKFGFNEDFLREEEIIKLDRIGEIIERIVAGNPREVFLIEGHTDLVGSDAYNEALSYRRAAAVRDALTEFFYIPARNLEIVGYGEQFPRIPTEFEEPENRRVTVRRITPILYGQSR